jgi:hypothetical protein
VDFGIVSAASGTMTQTVTVTNLSGATQTFPSAKDGGASATSYTLTEASSDCGAGVTAGSHTLAAGSSCHITLGLAASRASSGDGPVHVAWKIASRDVVVTGYVQAAAVSVSSSEVDFGLQIGSLTGGLVKLPRYLYLSNNSDETVGHALVSLPKGSVFSVSDECPSMLPPQSVCRLDLSYTPSNGTS